MKKSEELRRSDIEFVQRYFAADRRNPKGVSENVRKFRQLKQFSDDMKHGHHLVEEEPPEEPKAVVLPGLPTLQLREVRRLAECRHIEQRSLLYSLFGHLTECEGIVQGINESIAEFTNYSVEIEKHSKLSQTLGADVKSQIHELQSSSDHSLTRIW